MNSRTLLRLAFAALLLVPVTAGAQGFGHGRGDGTGPRHGAGSGPGDGNGAGFLRMLLPPPGYLDLTDEQKDAVKTLVDDLQAKIEPVHDQMQAIHEQLEAELDKENPSAEVVGQLVIEGKGLRESVRTQIEGFETAFVALLTPDQATAYENYKELRGAGRHGRRHGGGMGDGPGGPGGPGGFGG